MSRLVTNGRTFDFAEGPVVMGILNVTPDSFSDGGRNSTLYLAVRHAIEMVEQGAVILDVGGESTRPGHEPVPEEEEYARVIPVIQELTKELPQVALSVDTSKARVARGAIEAGACIFNDVTALEGDSESWQVLRDTGAGCVLTHHFQLAAGAGMPEVRSYLDARLAWACEKTGLTAEHFAYDPGIGFGKNLEQNLEMTAAVGFLRKSGRPVLLGPSRKSFLGILTGRPVAERLAGTLAAVSVGAYLGAEILRVHDVGAAVDAVRVATAMRAAKELR